MWEIVVQCYPGNIYYKGREEGNRVETLTKDHKPSDKDERKRIIAAGGRIYQMIIKGGNYNDDHETIGPYRVLPGKLSVCRAFGDAESKIGIGGNPNVIISTPEIRSIKIDDKNDFIIMGCDGIFDKLSSIEAVQSIWNTVKTKCAINVHKQCGFAVEDLLRQALDNKSLDNVTSLIIAFPNFKQHLETKNNFSLYKTEDKENQDKNILRLRNKIGVPKNSAYTKMYTTQPKVIYKIVDKKHFDFKAALGRINIKSLTSV